MGNFGETVGKKERDKKKLKERQEKAEKMEERRANAQKGKSLEDMMAYIDENGNISANPPDPRMKKQFRQEDMQISIPKNEDREQIETLKTGVVSFFNEPKGFGFIKDAQTQQSVFVHVNQMTERIKEGDKVVFETEKGPRGISAINVKKGA